MKFFLFHCWGADGNSCWSGWLGKQLVASGMASSVLAPDFPDSENPKLGEWLVSARKFVPHFNPKDDWVLVGHSLGCPMILRLLETFEKDEKAACIILVAGFAKDIGIPEILNFVDKDFDWEKIKKKTSRIIIINSDNDPYIQLDEAKRMAGLLGAELIVEKGAGHINEGSGFKSYPRLMEIIKKIKG
jgi:predicted alpha/beta hydrolase family esterase